MPWISTKRASEMLGVSEIRVRQLIDENRVKAQKLGREWMVSEASVKAFKPAKRGRPRKRAK